MDEIYIGVILVAALVGAWLIELSMKNHKIEEYRAQLTEARAWAHFWRARRAEGLSASRFEWEEKEGQISKTVL